MTSILRRRIADSTDRANFKTVTCDECVLLPKSDESDDLDIGSLAETITTANVSKRSAIDDQEVIARGVLQRAAKEFAQQNHRHEAVLRRHAEAAAAAGAPEEYCEWLKWSEGGEAAGDLATRVWTLRAARAGTHGWLTDEAVASLMANKARAVVASTHFRSEGLPGLLATPAALEKCESQRVRWK